MRISNAPINNIFELHMHKVNASPQVKSAEVQKSDQLDISRQATDLKNVGQYISKMPDVRADVVSKFRSAIESGGYQASDHDLADAVLKNALKQ